jgi:heterodisulfide reductase subunit A
MAKRESKNREQRIGVFICSCGTNIGGVIDVRKLARDFKDYPGVVHSTSTMFTCSKDGQDTIAKAIRDKELTGVVIGACTPKLHEQLFREILEENDMNAFRLAQANLREHDTWVHGDKPEEAYKVAYDLVAAAIERAKTLEDIGFEEYPVEKSAMVIGAGIAGIQCALDLADKDIKVYLVERYTSIGGYMARLEKTFPTLDCSMCILSPKLSAIQRHKNIELLSYSEVLHVERDYGNFKVRVQKKPRYVDPETCINCGACERNCPATGHNEWDLGLGERKAVYKPFPQAVPGVYFLDKESCLHWTDGCTICAEKCPRDSISYEVEAEEIELTVGAVVAATGFQEVGIEELPEYGGGKYRRVVTAGQYGRILSLVGPTEGEVLMPPEFEESPKRVAYINCAGSRDEKCRPWCCNFGCMYTLRHAEMTTRLLGDVEQWIIYHELRAGGKEYEQFYGRVRESGVRFVRGFPGDMTEEEDGTISFTVFDQGSGALLRLNFDLVVLTMAVDPSPDTAELAHMLGVDRSEGGFMKELHPKLEPVNTKSRGVFIAGACQSPKDIPASVADAKAAASAAASHVLKGTVRVQMDKAIVEEDLCIGCGLCEKVCPYAAISMCDRDTGPQLAEVNSLLCTGCGKCQVVCPTGAIRRKHFTTEQIEAEILGLMAAQRRREQAEKT